VVRQTLDGRVCQSRLKRLLSEDIADAALRPAVRRALAELRIGDELTLELRAGQAHWTIRTRSGRIAGRTANNYQPPVGRIVSARVAAICARRMHDVAAAWQARMAVDTWELVLPELVIEPQS
jgi:hypothetical protein